MPPQGHDGQAYSLTGRHPQCETLVLGLTKHKSHAGNTLQPMNFRSCIPDHATTTNRQDGVNPGFQKPTQTMRTNLDAEAHKLARQG